MDTQQLIQITSIDTLIDESKAFLKNIEQLKHAGNLGIIIHTHDERGNKNQTILYKNDNYVLIVPKGDKQKALLYGDWEEALYASKKLLLASLASQPLLQISIAQYLF